MCNLPNSNRGIILHGLLPHGVVVCVCTIITCTIYELLKILFSSRDFCLQYMNFERSGGSKGGLQGLQFLLWMKVFNKLLFRGKRYQTWFTPCLNFSGSTPGETSPLYTYFSDKKKTLMLIIIDTRFELFNKYLAYRPLMIFILIFTSGSYFTLLR